MANIVRIIILLAIVLPIASCGLKGKLKSPEQIEKLEAKKAQQEAQKAQDDAKKSENMDAETSTPAEKK